jgi:hypothetical protein
MIIRRCQLWVEGRHRIGDVRFTPKKRTFGSTAGMSAKCHKRTSGRLLHPKRKKPRTCPNCQWN